MRDGTAGPIVRVTISRVSIIRVSIRVNRSRLAHVHIGLELLVQK